MRRQTQTCRKEARVNFFLILRDVTLLRKKCNEIINLLQDSFFTSDKSGSDFAFSQIKPKIANTREKKTVNQLNLTNASNLDSRQIETMTAMVNQNSFIISTKLECPYIEDCIMSIKKDSEKLKKFKEMVEFYTQR